MTASAKPPPESNKNKDHHHSQLGKRSSVRQQASQDTYSKQSVGRMGEDIASSYLEKKGYQILARNFYARPGELDIVAIHDNTLVFVEVKTRLNTRYGMPEESVTPRKLKEIIHTASYFAMKHPGLPESHRIDVIGIILTLDETIAYFNHIISVTE